MEETRIMKEKECCFTCPENKIYLAHIRDRDYIIPLYQVALIKHALTLLLKHRIALKTSEY